MLLMFKMLNNARYGFYKRFAHEQFAHEYYAHEHYAYVRLFKLQSHKICALYECKGMTA